MGGFPCEIRFLVVHGRPARYWSFFHFPHLQKVKMNIVKKKVEDGSGKATTKRKDETKGGEESHEFSKIVSESVRTEEG